MLRGVRLTTRRTATPLGLRGCTSSIRSQPVPVKGHPPSPRRHEQPVHHLPQPLQNPAGTHLRAVQFRASPLLPLGIENLVPPPENACPGFSRHSYISASPPPSVAVPGQTGGPNPGDPGASGHTPGLGDCLEHRGVDQTPALQGCTTPFPA